MIVTNNDAIAEKLYKLSLHGMSKNAWKRYSNTNSWWYDVEQPGFKYNMTDIQAALGLVQLSKINELQNRRSDIVSIYRDELESRSEIEFLHDEECIDNSYHLMVVKLKLGNSSFDRDTVIEKLHKKGINTSVHFIPIHMHSYYRKKLQF